MPPGVFRNAPLRLLDRIYGFVGGLRGVRSVDLSSPIVLVHDVSREAELGTYSGIGIALPGSAYFAIVHDHVHAGADTVADSSPVYENQSAAAFFLAGFPPIDPDKETVWIVGAGGMSLNGLTTVAYIQVALLPKASAGSGTGVDQAVIRWSGSDSVANSNGDHPLRTTEPGFGQYPFPIPITNKALNNSPILWTSATSGADTIDMWLNCIRLPVGVFPPGYR